MQLEKSHLLAEIDLEQIGAVLSAWSWLLQEEAWSPLLVSAAGDIFLANSDGAVFRLDTGMGELERVTENVAIFQQSLNDSSLVRDWLLEPVVEELRANGKVLGWGQCYGFTVLPVFEEGSYKADNRFVLSAAEHVRYTGDIHRQIQGLADGEKVQVRVVP